jgi:rhodanese-related sulfurtransferase
MKAITTSELKALRHEHEDLILVNTLAHELFYKTRIPGAINIPLDDISFVTRVEQEAGGKTAPVVVYCANRHCHSSEKAARKLEAAEFTSVWRYTGGAEAWQKEVGDVSMSYAG